MLDIKTGISIIMNRWLGVEPGGLLLFITDENHIREKEAVERWALGQDAALKAIRLDSRMVQQGDIIQEIAPLLDSANVIVGATDYSFITTEPVSSAVSKGARFLSLPLSCADGTSLLENDFIDMDPAWAQRKASRLIRHLRQCDMITVTTRRGTDLRFFKRGREPGCYCGKANRRGSISSASFEVFVPIEEYKTEGTLILDGSFGYLGLVSAPMEIRFQNGRLSTASDSADARRLLQYMDSFQDDAIYQAAEFGIGLNSISRCRGISYIEDESAFHTFHIGFGRNITLGGRQDAAGHFDIVTHEPTIYAGDTLIMKDGEIAC